MAQFLSDADVGIGQSQPQTFLSDADVGIGQPQSFTGKLANLWEHPPAGPSLIGAAHSLYDAVMTPGRTMQAAEDQSNKTSISDSDIPLSSASMVAPAFNMASNVVLPAPGVADAASLLPKRAPAPAYGGNSIQQKAADIVSAPLKERGLTTSPAVEGALAKVGPEAVLADADPRLTQMAGTIAAKPGPAQQIIRNALEARNSGAADRILSTTNSVMGEPIDLAAMSDQIHNAAKSAVSPLYAEAYKAPLSSTPELEAALGTPFAKTALAKAANMAKSDISSPPSVMFGSKKAAMPGNMTAAQYRDFIANQSSNPVDVRGLHLTRQALDDMIRVSQRQGSNNKTRILSDLRSQIDAPLKSVEPFAQADKIYADKSRIQDAMAEGLGVFKNSKTPQDVSAALTGMSDAERQAYQQGARAAVRNVMGTARNDAAAARGMFAKEFNQEKLAALFGRDESNKLLSRINSEAAFANTDQRVLRNSETAARAYGREALDQAHGIPSYRDVAVFSGAHGLARRAVIGGINRVMDAAASGRQEAIEAEVAKLLSLGRNDRAQILSSVLQEARRRDPSGRLRATILPIVLQHQAGEQRPAQR